MSKGCRIQLTFFVTQEGDTGDGTERSQHSHESGEPCHHVALLDLNFSLDEVVHHGFVNATYVWQTQNRKGKRLLNV